MGSFNVIVTFKGLCLYHVEPQARGKRVRVVLVNALESRKARDGVTDLPKHKPLLYFNKDHCKNLNDLPSSDQNGQVDLKELTVKVGAADDPTQVPMIPDIQYGTVPGGSWGPETQFQWIAPLQKLCRPIHNGPNLRRSCLEHPLPRNKYAVSRVHLGAGMLECSRMAKNDKASAIPWDFKDPTTGEVIWNQALSDWVTFTVSGLEEPYPISLDRQGTQFRTILIDPRPSQAVTSWVRIENGPVAEPRDPKEVKHFLWFFELLEPPSEVNPIPVTNDTVVLPDHVATPGNAFCPPASWNE